MFTLKCPGCNKLHASIIKVSRCRGTVYDRISPTETDNTYTCIREELDESTLTFMCYRCEDCGYEGYKLIDFIIEIQD